MKNLKGKIFILIASIITGILIMINIDLNKTSYNISLNAVEYKKALEERNKLYKEIESIKSENIDYRYKISKYEGNDPEKNKKLVEDMKSQLFDYGKLSGVTAVKGPGLVIKVQDGDIDKVLDTERDIMRKIFHQEDMALIINEARKAGAEAIAVNNHRVLPNTGASCNSAFIGFEDYSREYGPFYIYMIGDPEKMKASLLSENSHIQKLILRKIKVDIEQKDEMIIPATSQNTEAMFMQRYEGK
ncbi:DUF881 domain-containing protein [Clostridium sp. MB05]